MNQDDPVIPSSIPHPFAEIARGCLRSNPAQRFTVADVRDALGIGRPAPESSEVAPGKVPPLGRLGILVVPIIVIAAVLVVREVSMHMRARQTAISASQQQQVVPDAAQPKPSAATRRRRNPRLSPNPKPRPPPPLSPRRHPRPCPRATPP